MKLIQSFLLAWVTTCTLTAQDKGFLLQTEIKGLLVFEIGNGALASQASQMNATLVPADGDGTFTIGFNQEVGDQMSAATSEVEKFIRLRNPGALPLNRKIEFAFENKHNPKDGPSAAVVCALMADSILKGKKIDPSFAATGDMTATGAVLPVGGVADKIRGAIKQDCALVAIPQRNQLSISDLYVQEGMKPLYEIQIFTLEDYEEATQVAFLDRDPKMQEAISEFARIQKVFAKNEGYITNGKVRKKLEKVCNLAPNHLSANLLLLHSLGRAPSKLSLAGSIDAIESADDRLGGMLNDDSFRQTGGNDDVLSRLVIELNTLRPQLDRRTWRYADANRELAEFVMSIRSKKYWNTQSERQCKEAINRVKAEAKRLSGNADIMEELRGS